ncbi:UDP-glucosyltransferase, putative [Ricinus communis]|uniref:UDP-glucosyltransferase, putative n=1 Tax=Ricinus communis TaxID=3988 RepID=B9SSW4_RICCO|nr:UDP-glucosyltransferase, putative [Ricinus communis]
MWLTGNLLKSFGVYPFRLFFQPSSRSELQNLLEWVGGLPPWKEFFKPVVNLVDYHTTDTNIINWPCQKDSCSVVYVSSGIKYFLSREELEEVANGLELSKVSFIWVVRFQGGDRVSIQEALPKGFLKRVGKRGLVVAGWAPQANILEHSSIGGLISHFSGSSTLEGMVLDVPITAMPMHLDQPLNDRLVVEIGVGMEVPRKSNERHR